MKILLPIDGSLPALQAVRHAIGLVEHGLRASFVLVNVQEAPSLYEVVVAHNAEVIDQVRGAAGTDLLRSAEALVDAAAVDYESEVVSGDPAHQLVDQLENYGCDAVIMGGRGLSKPDAADLGSVAQSVLRHSPVPVTVVRSRPDERVDDAAGEGGEGGE
jgi:nucleotide-binding universal stress UspA family protein